MSILGKFMDSVKFNSEDEDDDYFLDDEYDDEGYDEGSEGRKGGLFGKKAAYEEKPSGERRSGGFLNRKVVPIRQGAGGMEVTMIKDVTPIPHNGCRPPKRRRV